MGTTTGIVQRRSRTFLVTSLTLSAAVALARPAFQTKAYAAGNQYEWVKQVDQDLLGGSYTSVASSSDGSHLIIGTRDGGEGSNAESPLYVSDDYGATWSNVTDDTDARIRNNWQSVDVTDNGHTMVAASDSGINLDDFNSTDGKIFISQDSGATWENISPGDATEWQTVAISGDGNEIAAVANDDLDHVYISTNGGDTWQTSNVSGVGRWHSLSISDNGGKILLGGENTGDLAPLAYISTSNGDTWTDVTPDHGDLSFATKTAMSADGSKMVVSVNGYTSGAYDEVYMSEDDGAHWTDIKPNDPDANQWNAIAMAGNGSMLAIQDYNDKMYVSNDDGASWTAEDPGQADDDTDNWRTIDFNFSGSRIITASDAFAYVGHDVALDTSATVSNAESGTSIVVTTPDGTTITCHTPVKESGLSAQDGAYSYPLGLVDFCFSGADASNGITLVFVTDLKPNQVVVRKYNPTTKEYATITGATVTETTLGGQHALQVAYTITDNGPLDTDPSIGEVSDPVGLAVTDVNAPDTGFAQQSASLPIAALLAGGSLAAALLASPIRRKIARLVTTKK